MTILKKLFFLFFCQSLAFSQEVTEEGTNPSNNYIFDLPDIVANFETLGEEVQLEAFGAREVTFLSCEINLKKKNLVCIIWLPIFATKPVFHNCVSPKLSSVSPKGAGATIDWMFFDNSKLIEFDD